MPRARTTIIDRLNEQLHLLLCRVLSERSEHHAQLLLIDRAGRILVELENMRLAAASSASVNLLGGAHLASTFTWPPRDCRNTRLRLIVDGEDIESLLLAALQVGSHLILGGAPGARVLKLDPRGHAGCQ